MGPKATRSVKRTQQTSDRRPHLPWHRAHTEPAAAAPEAAGKPPLLFVDVDGVLSLYGFPREAPLPGAFHAIDGILHCIGTDAAARLKRLAERFELVWATGWEEKANEYLVHILELPAALPVLTFDGRAVFGSAHWKLDAIDEHARGRPAAWIDDNLDEACRRWARKRSEPTLLVETEHATGILEEHVETLLAWADQVSPRSRAGS